MTTTELLALFRTEVFDLELPYLWSDTWVYGAIDAAQKQFCRDTFGVADSRSFTVNIISGTQWYTTDAKILKIRDAVVSTTGLDMPLIAFEKMHENSMKFDDKCGPPLALITGLDENTLRVWPIPFTRTVPVVRANSTAYVVGDIITVVSGATTRYFACVVPGTTAAAVGTLYDGAYTAPITDGTASFADDTASLSSTVELRTFRLPITVEAGDDFEIPEQHQRYLLHWVKYLAYSIHDAETYDKGAAERYFAMHKAYCAQAKIEQSRARRPVSTVTYGGV